jgi:LacI family transcriptional regulator
VDAAKALNYHPSAAAQALSKGKTDCIAFVYKRLHGDAYRLAYTGLIDELSAEFQEAGFDLNVANFATQEEVLAHLQKLGSSHACDAVVLWGREEDTEPQAQLLERMKIPFVVKGRHEKDHPSWQQVDFDHERMTRKAVEHLVSLGHTRIAYLGFPHVGYLDAHCDLLAKPANLEYVGEFEDEVAPNADQIRRWLALPGEERPTGFAIGSGNRSWQALELCLAEIGFKLSDEPGGFSAAGITSSPFSLIFGHAQVYQGVEVDHLATLVTPALLHATQMDEDCQRIHRFQPELTPAESLEVSVPSPLETSLKRQEGVR